MTEKVTEKNATNFFCADDCAMAEDKVSPAVNLEENTEPLKAIPLPVEDEPVTPFFKAEESEEYIRLEREFNEYKRKNALLKIDGVLVDGVTALELKNSFTSLLQNARARAVVMPNQITLAKKVLPPSMRVDALVNYPYATGSKKAVLCEIKAVLQQKVGVLVGVDTLKITENNLKPTEKLLKYLSKLSLKKKVSPTFSTYGLNLEQINKLAKLVKQFKFERVILALGNNTAELPRVAEAVRAFYDALGGQCFIDVVGKVSTSIQAEILFNAGAERIITTDYKTLSTQKFDNVTV